MKNPRDSTRSETLDVGTDAKVEFLGRPEAYAEGTESVEVLQTHMSWVFLTERFAYKLKKPVRYEFLDFRTIEARHRNCEEEVRLNRRLAPAVYLGVVPLTLGEDGGLHLGEFGKAVDWLVKMHRLPRDQMLDQAILDRCVTVPRIKAIGMLLANFYRNTEPVAMTADGYRARLVSEIAANLHHLSEPAYGLPREPIEKACRAQTDFIERRSDLFDRRVRDRRIIEAHGDLRPEHICLGPSPQIIDCLEFKRDFRILDPVDELSFLSLECERLGAPFIGPVIFDAYSAVTDDSWPEDLIFFYKSFRACLRAKISVWHLREADVREPAKWMDLTQTYLALADAYAEKLA